RTARRRGERCSDREIVGLGRDLCEHLRLHDAFDTGLWLDAAAHADDAHAERRSETRDLCADAPEAVHDERRAADLVLPVILPVATRLLIAIHMQPLRAGQDERDGVLGDLDVVRAAVVRERDAACAELRHADEILDPSADGVVPAQLRRGVEELSDARAVVRADPDLRVDRGRQLRLVLRDSDVVFGQELRELLSHATESGPDHDPRHWYTAGASRLSESASIVRWSSDMFSGKDAGSARTTSGVSTDGVASPPV